MLAKLLTCVDIRQMHFDEGDRHAEEGIAQGDTRVRECAGVDNNETNILGSSRMDRIDELVLSVALERCERQTDRRRLRDQPVFYFGKARVAICLWLTLTEQI